MGYDHLGGGYGGALVADVGGHGGHGDASSYNNNNLVALGGGHGGASHDEGYHSYVSMGDQNGCSKLLFEILLCDPCNKILISCYKYQQLIWGMFKLSLKFKFKHN